MTNVWRGSSVGLAIAIVVWQATSCCCCLGGAVSPPMTPLPISTELAHQLRDQVNELQTGPDTVAIEVSDEELTSYVVGRLQSGAGEFPARDMQIRFDDRDVNIWATFIDVAPTDIPIYVQATVEAVDGELVFFIRQANAGPFPVPGALREMISQILSESLAELSLGYEIERVQLVPGAIILEGRVTGDLPDLP